jgi:hypothetical protein
VTVRISFSELWTHVGDERGSLTSLEHDGELGHIHGRLQIVVDGRVIPQLGFFDEADVCFNAWLVELCTIVHALAHDDASYTFDEGEQGQPAFLFERRGREVFFSITASEIGDGAANPEWQRVSFDYEDFRAEVERFIDALRAELRIRIPTLVERWWPKGATIVGERF